MRLIRRRDVLKSAAIVAIAAGANGAPCHMPTKRAAFVLVHGAFHGGWCYARVATILRGLGHYVYTPTLTGLGERSHLAKLGVNCSTHIQDVLNVIRWEQLHNVVLCGHSNGGMVIGGVADRIPDRIASLVYIDAAIPENGMSILDLLDSEGIVSLLRSTADYGGEFVPPLPAMALNVNQADRAMVDALCTPQPIATFTERLHLTGAHMMIPRKTYILATAWENPGARRIYARIKNASGWATFEVACGHDVMLDAPERLAELLLRAM